MRKPRPQVTDGTHFPAPTGGMNTVDAASALPEGDAHLLINMINSENGLRPRSGYAEWVTGLGAEVRSVFDYNGSQATLDRVFAATPTAIWDVSTFGAPVSVFNLPSPGGSAGQIRSINFTTPGGRFLVCGDEDNGYLLRSESAGTFAQVTAAQVTGVNPNLLVLPVAFKSRLWFVEKYSTRAWYLPINSIYGAAVAFDFGAQFAHGGRLAALYVWTMDGGSGADDMLVAVGTAGDVVIYQGTDPAQMGTFSKVGGWFVGGVPNGRDLAATFGGELLLLTSGGLLPLSRLVAGKSLLAPDTFATYKIRNLINAAMVDRGSSSGWGLHVHPTDNCLMINFPTISGEAPQQFVLTASGSSLYAGVPVNCATTWHRRLYFGTSDGRVCTHDGTIDNVTLDGDATKQVPVSWGGITAYRAPGGLRKKRVHMITPRLLTQGSQPVCSAVAVYDFNLARPALLGGTVAPKAGAWDAGASVFDDPMGKTVFQSGGDSFGSGTIPFTQIGGSVGLGTFFAVAFSGTSTVRTNLIGFDVMLELGGLL